MINSNFQPFEFLQNSYEDKWYALYTKSRHEKFIYAEMQKKKIEAFLPLRFIKKRWSDRTVTIEEPLFKGYLFIKANQLTFSDIIRTKGAVKLVAAGAAPVSIHESVIASLKNVIQPNIIVDPFPYLKQGDRVYVKSGLFKGTEGFVFRKNDKKCRLIISVDAIGASISVELDSCLVEKL